MRHAFGFVLAAAAAAGFAAHVSAQNGNPVNTGSADAIAIAVFGDWPYSQNLKDTAQRLIDSVNSDAKVRLVIHLGDIHSGSMPCTGADLTPAPATSVATWNTDIFNLFQQFKDPLVYTPGDNEWTDCHKTKEFTSGSPLLEVASVRRQFFFNPGHTLGLRSKRVVTQAEAYDPGFPDDAAFVENVMWEDSQVVFVTLNVPGS